MMHNQRSATWKWQGARILAYTAWYERSSSNQGKEGGGGEGEGRFILKRPPGPGPLEWLHRTLQVVGGLV